MQYFKHLRFFILNFFLGYTPPTRRTVPRQLKRLRSKHTHLLLNKLKGVDSIAVTTDLWSDKKLSSYLCLTGHFLNNVSKLTSKVLSFTYFDERHTGDQISYTIKKELKRLQVYEKTHTITCDGGSNIRKAFLKRLKLKDYIAWPTNSIWWFVMHFVYELNNNG